VSLERCFCKPFTSGHGCEIECSGHGKLNSANLCACDAHFGGEM
jgi:hypothetical protein